MSDHASPVQANLIEAIRAIVPAEPAIAAIVRATQQQPGLKATRGTVLSPADFSCFFSGDYEDGLYFVPQALEHIQGMQPGYGEVCCHLAGFLWVRTNELNRDGLFDLCLHELRSLFAFWCRQFQAFTRVERTRDGVLHCHCDAEEPGPFDMVLDGLTEWDVQRDAMSVRHWLLADWAERISSPAASASVLDFALRTRCCPNSMLVYREPRVLQTVFNSRLMYAHRESCESLLRSNCSVEYGSMIEETLT